MKSPVKRPKLWKRFRSSFRVTSKTNKPESNINPGVSPAEVLECMSPKSPIDLPFPPPNSAFKSQTAEALTISSNLPFLNSPSTSIRKKTFGISDSDKVVLVGQHTTDRLTITSPTNTASSNQIQSLKTKENTEKSISISWEARDDDSTLRECKTSLCDVAEVCVEQYAGDSSALLHDSIKLELEVKRAMIEISSQKIDAGEVEIVKRLKETLRILEADAVVSRDQCKEQKERILEQKLAVDQLKGREENLKQVLSHVRIQSEKLSKALQDKNRDLFKVLANVSQKLYKRQHVRRLELTAKVLAEQLARVRDEGDSPDENISPKSESISDGKYSPKVLGLKNAGKSESLVISPRKEAKIRSDFEQKKLEAFDIKLKFFEKEMEVSRLKSILERSSRSHQSKRVSGFGGAAFKQQHLADTISEGGPYEFPVDFTKKGSSPRRYEQQNASWRAVDSRIRSYSMGGKKDIRKQRMYNSPQRKSSAPSRAWKT